MRPVIQWHGWVYEVDGEVLMASYAGLAQIRLPLAPVIEGESTTIKQWSRAETNHFVGRLGRLFAARSAAGRGGTTEYGKAEAPYLQPWADTDMLCEEWNGYTDNWYRRGQIATRTMSGLLFVTDAWFVTLTKGYEYYMGMMAWNYPQTNAVGHAIHPYTHYRELQEKDFKRRNAGSYTVINQKVAPSSNTPA